ncbi:hypothetical protein EAE96_007762 [Botrytis aclada]|nr:hypothetical protein EAE96_007762 [Botrytis aclada]
MAQNIYDQEDFFKAYAQLPRSVHGLEKAPEFQVLRSWLPSLEGSSFLDLGCGFGWMCRWARENGAKSVQGTDVSENMLARARNTQKILLSVIAKPISRHYRYLRMGFMLPTALWLFITSRI